MRRDALISADGQYRYWLTREWGHGSWCGFIMLNPSTADASVDDPTIRRCISFAREWGHGGILVANLFALRSPDPKALKAAENPVGPSNDKFLGIVAERCDRLVAAWGSHPFAAARAKEVSERFAGQLSCLGTTKAGHPRHPLYLKKDTTPVKFKPGAPA